MFVVGGGQAATAAPVAFSAQGVTAAAMMKPGRPDLSAGERSQEVLPYGFPRGVGWGGGKTNQVHLLKVGGESKIKSSCRRLLAGRRWTYSAGAGLHGGAGIWLEAWREAAAAVFFRCDWYLLLISRIYCHHHLPAGR